MEFKGTKGKWVVENKNPDGVLKNITCREFSDWFVCENVGEYDAKLIASAPDLLEALQEVVKLQEDNYGNGIKTHIRLDTLCNGKLKQLINKALNG